MMPPVDTPAQSSPSPESQARRVEAFEQRDEQAAMPPPSNERIR
jgi:hypothetical protein